MEVANKLNTVLSRAEERDLVDLYTLERAGYRLEDALPAALAKDGGCTPAMLAWLLSQIRIDEGHQFPAGISGPELRRFVEQLIVRFRKMASPA